MSSGASRVLDLRSVQDWDLARLLGPDLSELWGGSLVHPLGELAALRTARDTAAENEPVVSPGGVDVNTGAVRTTRTRSADRLVLRMRSDDSGIRVNDVLLPLIGTGPCVLLSTEHAGLSFTNFVALRSPHPIVGVWLWAVLTSARGLQLRRAISTGSMVPRVALSGLAAAPVPEPRPYADPLYRELAALHAAAGIAPTSEGRSWWRVTRLAEDGDWHRQLATPNPEIFDDGTPLGDLADVVAGRNPRLTFETARPGTLPVLNGRSVDGDRVNRWAEPGSGPDAQPGDVAVVEVGQRGRAAVVRQPAIAGTGVLLVRPHVRTRAQALARYLDSEPAQALRMMLVTGHIPRLSARTLSQLPVPVDALEEQASPVAADRRSLAEKLEQVLWT